MNSIEKNLLADFYFLFSSENLYSTISSFNIFCHLAYPVYCVYWFKNV